MKALLLLGGLWTVGMSIHPPAAEPPAAAPDLSPREAVIAYADSCVGWKEATGHNDGRRIDEILGSVGLAGTRNPYCAAFVYYVGKMALADRNPYPRSAWSPDMVRAPTWVKGHGIEPLPGDTFGIYFANKGRVAHTGLVRRNLGNIVETLEGNTSPDALAGSAADRDGGGVYRKRRLKSQIYAFRSWFPN